MDLLALLTALSAQIAEAQASTQALADQKFAEGKAAGFAEGVASVTAPPASDKVLSRAEVDAMLAPIQADLDAVKAQVVALQDKLNKYEAAIQAEIDDAKVDSSRLESFVASL